MKVTREKPKNCAKIRCKTEITPLQAPKRVIEYPMFRQSVGFFAVSKCGHDAGTVYAVVDSGPRPADGKKDDKKSKKPAAPKNDVPRSQSAVDCLWVANGTNRTLACPKRKNPAHLAVTKARVPNLPELLSGEPVSSNLRLKKLVEDYAAAHRPLTKN
jgi:hypothetical protein